MKPDQAGSIVTEYAQVLQTALKGGTVAGESALPYDKTTIRVAIMTDYAESHRRDRDLLDAFRDTFASAYMYLGAFVAEEDARDVRDLEAALSGGPRTESRLKALLADGTFSQERFDRYQTVSKRVSHEMDLLLAEFHGFEKGIGARRYCQCVITEMRVAADWVKRKFDA